MFFSSRTGITATFPVHKKQTDFFVMAKRHVYKSLQSEVTVSFAISRTTCVVAITFDACTHPLYNPLSNLLKSGLSVTFMSQNYPQMDPVICTLRPLSKWTLRATRLRYADDTTYTTGYRPRTLEAIHSKRYSLLQSKYVINFNRDNI